MNERERFLNILNYRPVDRCPIWDFGFWDETLVVWRQQGMPEDSTPDDFFGMDTQWRGLSVNIGLFPAFEWRVVEDRGETEVVQDRDGVLFLQRKFMKTIPHYIDWKLKDRASWAEHFKPRLDPAMPGRVPDHFAEQCRQHADAGRTYPISINAGSLFGWLRNWMGFENIALLTYDDEALFSEMVETLGNLTISILGRALQIAKDNGLTFDYASMWEDMCFNHGPLIGPTFVERYMKPQYCRITDLLRQYGCHLVVLDCDGKIDELIPIWLAAGVNVMFPLEVGTWGGDPVAYRERFGREMRILGGFDKHILARGKDAITKEVERLAPLVEAGGFIPFCDHRVPPDVSLTNYLHYIELAKKAFGRGLDVRPTGKSVGVAGG